MKRNYHKKTINKGVLGEISKIEEELDELKDAHEQKVKLLIGCELADLYGAIESYAENQGFQMKDIIEMSNLTKSAILCEAIEFCVEFNSKS